MAAVLTPKSFTFPHNILQETRGSNPIMRVERNTPSRPSLPSISSLMNDIELRKENSPLRSPGLDLQRRISPVSQPPSPDKVSSLGYQHIQLPPSPSLPGTSSFDFINRSSTGSNSPIVLHSTNTYSTPSPSGTNADIYTIRTSAYPPLPDQHRWSASSSPKSSDRIQDQSTSAVPTLSIKSETPYSELTEAHLALGGLVQQRPLPSNFPSIIPTPGQQLPPIDPQMVAAQYQHHHHYSAANSPTYSNTTDRYQCPTCQKAFSRPSSLKIHTYSHTGEKPFKCKHDGCGKYFSVRSNMKRHEKGCHGLDTSSTEGNSPLTN